MLGCARQICDSIAQQSGELIRLRILMQKWYLFEYGWQNCSIATNAIILYTLYIFVAYYAHFPPFEFPMSIIKIRDVIITVNSLSGHCICTGVSTWSLSYALLVRTGKC